MTELVLTVALAAVLYLSARLHRPPPRRIPHGRLIVHFVPPLGHPEITGTLEWTDIGYSETGRTITE